MINVTHVTAQTIYVIRQKLHASIAKVLLVLCETKINVLKY